MNGFRLITEIERMRNKVQHGTEVRINYRSVKLRVKLTSVISAQGILLFGGNYFFLSAFLISSSTSEPSVTFPSYLDAALFCPINLDIAAPERRIRAFMSTRLFCH